MNNTTKKIGEIELNGVRSDSILYPWNSHYNINDTMLFENSWFRLNLHAFVGKKCLFYLDVNDEVSATILDSFGKNYTSSECNQIEVNYNQQLKNKENESKNNS